MGRAVVRIGIAGCGTAARIHLDRLLAVDQVRIVGCADPDLSAAAALADRASLRSETGTERPVPSFADYRELLRAQVPDALAIFTPHLLHYRLTMDALQAGCHVFIEKPLSTNVQEAADIVSLAKGRHLKVAVGQQFRLSPSLIEARRRIAQGAIGPIRLVTCLLARPWLTTLGRQESTWRFNTKMGGGGILSDAGDHLIDALLWTTGQTARGRRRPERLGSGNRSRDGRRNSPGGRNSCLACHFGNITRRALHARVLWRAGTSARHRLNFGGTTNRHAALRRCLARLDRDDRWQLRGCPRS